MITGPAEWPAAAPPPWFAIETARPLLYMVELAAARELMACETGRSPDNYFFGGDSSGVFAAGDRWQIPPEVWRLLGRRQVIYYRVLVVNHHRGTSEPSVDERHLDVVPVLRILHEGRGPV